MALELLSPVNLWTLAVNHKLFCTFTTRLAKSDKPSFSMMVPGKEGVQAKSLPLMRKMPLQSLWFHTLRMAQIQSVPFAASLFL